MDKLGNFATFNVERCCPASRGKKALSLVMVLLMALAILPAGVFAVSVPASNNVVFTGNTVILDEEDVADELTIQATVRLAIDPYCCDYFDSASLSF